MRSARTTSGAATATSRGATAQGITSADWVATTFTPAASACPGADGTRISAANCPTVTYFQPTFQQPSVVTLTNVPDFNRQFNGFELMARKRMADKWMMNSSFSFNSTTVNYGSFPGSQPSTAAAAITEDPTNRERAQRLSVPTT